jgi:hypothetical protein
MARDLEIQTNNERNSDGHSLAVAAESDEAHRGKKTRGARVATGQPESAATPLATDVATDGGTPVMHSAPEALIGAIHRALSNPAITPDQIDRLFLYQQDALDRSARGAYAAALARMQTELPIIQERGGIRDRAGNVMSRYALWEDIVGVVTPVLSRHGFSLSFRTGNGDGSVTVTGVLTHALGHEERTSLTLPIDTSGAKNAVQSIGSSTSYGKRYTASALLNLRSGATEDDDGIAGGGLARISAAQAAEVEALIDSVGANRAAMLDWLKVRSVELIPLAKFEAVKSRLEAKRK